MEVNKVNDGTDQMPENGVEEKKETMEQATEKEAKGKAKIGKKKKETPPQETEAIQALNMKLAQLEQEKEEYLQSLRLRADFENIKADQTRIATGRRWRRRITFRAPASVR